MKLYIPKAVLVAVLLVLAVGAGVVGTLVVVGGDGDRPALAADAPATKPRAAKPPKPVRLTVRALPKETSDQLVTIRGRTTRGATVTVRGKRAIVQRGLYSVRLKLRIGTNRFTVVARHSGRSPHRSVLKVNRVQPAPIQIAPVKPPQLYDGGQGHPESNEGLPEDCVQTLEGDNGKCGF